MNRPLGVGIAGFGRVAESCYAPALQALDCFEVRAIAEAQGSRRELASRLFPGAQVAETARACHDAGVDVWLIAVPPQAHYATARQVLEQGCHVYVEKPLTLDLREAQGLVTLARAAGRVAVTGYVERFTPAYLALRSQLQQRRGASISLVQTQLTFDEVVTVPWKRSVEQGGGALNDIAVHHADLVCFLLDTEVAAVRANTRSVRRPEDTAHVELRLANGVPVEAFFSSAAPAVNRLIVRAETREWRAARVPARSTFERRIRSWARRVAGPLAQGPDPAFLNCFAALARAIVRGDPMSPNLEDGARGVAFLEAAHESARKGRWVELQVGARGASP